ncbi:MAG: CBS domain-containing protein [Desulfovibrionales bacterium]|nr:MAG: CBS domain-containing protein [Desulfovibrionales bacterium]
MEKSKVRDVMVPVADFPRISNEATFFEAVLALEKNFDAFMSGQAKQRITLVHDAQNRIVGKLTPVDVVRGLEPGYGKMPVDISYSSFASTYQYVMEKAQEQTMLWSKPLDDLCKTAQDVKVKDFLRLPTEAQLVKADDSLNEALHRFVLGRNDSLFVTENGHLVGLVRFSDVYREIQQHIKNVCKI